MPLYQNTGRLPAQCCRNPGHPGVHICTDHVFQDAIDPPQHSTDFLDPSSDSYGDAFSPGPAPPPLAQPAPRIVPAQPLVHSVPLTVAELQICARADDIKDEYERRVEQCGEALGEYHKQ